MVAFLFDSSKIRDLFYGKKVFEYIIKLNELLNNMNKGELTGKTSKMKKAE